MKRLVLPVSAVLFAASLSAQMPRPTPAPELKKLDYFVGTWKVESELKPGAFGPGGKISGKDHIQWMEGNFFLIIHTEFASPSLGNGVEYSLIGYDSRNKQYTYSSFNSSGEHEVATGHLDAGGKVWTWDSAPGSEGPRWRYTETVLSPTSYAVKFEISNATAWSTVMEATATRQ